MTDAPDAVEAALARAAAAHRPGHPEGVATLVDADTWHGLLADPGLAPPADPPRLVVVLGAARSGTTWLQGRLLAHPDACGPSAETFLFNALAPLWHAGNRDRVRAIALHALEVHRATTAPTATHVVEKTPLHVFRLDVLADVAPDACFVHVVRDGRDVARSISQVDFFGPDVDVAAGGELWARAVEAVTASGLATVELRYEDLLDDLAGGLGRVAEAAGLRTDDDAMAAMTAGAGRPVSRHGTTGRVGAEQWRDLDPDVLRALERRHGRLLAAHGYAPATRARWPRRWRHQLPSSPAGPAAWGRAATRERP